MRVLITGATGFLGRAIVKDQLTRSNDVAVLTRRTSATTPLAALAGLITTIDGDIFSADAYRAQVVDFAPDAVVHCAWWGVDGALRNDRRQFDNISAIGGLVDVAARAGAKIMIGIGSQAEYGPCEGPTSETAPLRPTTLYGISKVAAGQALLQLAADHGMRGAWGRVYSLYGPDDDGPWLIPSMMRTFRSGQAPKVTPCEQNWDFLHVADGARAVASLAICDTAQGAFNIGSGVAVSLRDVILELRDLVAPDIEPFFGAIPYRTDQVMHLQADIGRLRATTGWSPRITLAEGLGETATAFTTRDVMV